MAPSKRFGEVHPALVPVCLQQSALARLAPKCTQLDGHADDRQGDRMATGDGKAEQSPSALIDGRIEELGDWRGETLAAVRALIKQEVPDVVEEWKWRGVPVWYSSGMICTGESYKNVVKVTFAKGARLKDPKKLFNSSLEGNTRRAIDIHEGDRLDEAAFKALIREAVALNES